MIDAHSLAAEWLDNLTRSPQVRRLIYHDGQAEIAASTAKYKVVACGRQFGKTEYGIDEVVSTALDGYPTAYFAQSYKASMKVWRALKTILLPVTAHKLEGEKIITLTTGGTVEMWSHDNVAAESVRGQKYKKVVIDEAALASMDIWTQIIWPMLASYDGDALFLSTPRGKLNWFYDIFRWGVEGKDGWQQFKMPTARNPYISREYLARVKAQMTPDEFAQEHLADFTIVAGAVYPDFKETENVTLEAEYHPDYPVLWCADDGYTNPRVIGLWQQRPMFGVEGCYCLFDLLYVTQELAGVSIQRVIDRDYELPEWVYYDPAAAEFGAVCQSFGLATWGAYNNIHEGIKVVRRFILDGNGVRRLFIHPRCRAAIDEIMAYAFPEGGRMATTGSGDPLPDKTHSHSPDMVRYLLATRHLHD